MLSLDDVQNFGHLTHPILYFTFVYIIFYFAFIVEHANSYEPAPEDDLAGQEEQEQDHEIDQILEKRIVFVRKKKCFEYLVNWKGLNPETGRPYPNSWVPEEKLSAYDLIKEYEESIQPGNTHPSPKTVQYLNSLSRVLTLFIGIAYSYVAGICEN